MEGCLTCVAGALASAASSLSRLSRCERGAPLVFQGCQVRRLVSREGLRYKLLISLPHSYFYPSQSEIRYPVVYALDAEPYLFPLIATVARTERFFRRTTWYPDFIVVGITTDLEEEFRTSQGVEVTHLWDNLRPTRARDYLPTSAESPWGAPGCSPIKEVSGHATSFCNFLASTLVPFVDREFRTQSTERALVGKSFGGSGVAHALLHDACSQLFEYYMLGSPTLSWDNGAFFRIEKEGHTERELRTQAYVSCGSKEHSQQTTIQKFKQVLESRSPEVSITMEVIAGEDHGSLSYPFACRSMAWLRNQIAKRNGADDSPPRSPN